MAGATFRVTDPRAISRAADAGIEATARQLARAASDRSPRVTGLLASSWAVLPGKFPGARVVVNTAPYARFVEYGTRDRPASAMLGRAVASGGRAVR